MLFFLLLQARNDSARALQPRNTLITPFSMRLMCFSRTLITVSRCSTRRKINMRVKSFRTVPLKAHKERVRWPEKCTAKKFFAIFNETTTNPLHFVCERVVLVVMARFRAVPVTYQLFELFCNKSVPKKMCLLEMVTETCLCESLAYYPATCLCDWRVFDAVTI